MTKARAIRQKAILVYICRHNDVYGFSPLFREIAAFIGESSDVVKQDMLMLENRGLIQRLPGVSRSLRLTTSGLALAKPVIARVLAAKQKVA